MRIVSLTIEGFQSWRARETVNLEGLDLVAIVGGNHVGKTTIIDAIRFALYGTSRGGSVNDVITRGAQLARVEAVLDVTAGRIRIVRTRTRRGQHEVYLAIADDTQPSGWRELAEKHSSDADARIVELVGSSESVARLTWLVGQGDAGAFCEAKPVERRAVLASAFGLDIYAALAKAADGRRKEAKEAADKARWTLEQATTRLAHLDASIELLDAQKVTADLETARRDQEKAATDLAAAREEALRVRDAQANRASAARAAATAAALRDRCAADLDRATTVADTLDELTARRDATRTELDEARATQERCRELVDEHTATDRELASQDAVAAAAEEELATRLDALGHTSGTCTVCESHLTDDQVTSLRSRTESRLAQARAARDVIAEQRKITAAVITTNRDVIADMASTVTRLTTVLSGLDSRIRSAQEAAASIPDLTAALTAAQAEHDQRACDLERLGDGTQAPAPDTSDLETRHAQAAAKVEELTGVQAQITLLSSQQEQVTGERTAAEDELAAKELELGRLELLVEAYRPGGIPSMILAGVVDELNTEANHVLASTGDDDLGVRVSMTRATGKGGTSEALTVYAVTAHGEVDYTTLSGSEKFRLALAVRLGLARCVARRTGTPVRTIILDEGWGALDEETRRAVGGVLASLAGQFGILTVSHVDDVKESFGHLVKVDMATGTSRAKVVPA